MQRAIEEGADFIESDILASKDGVLICHHDVILDDTTDIAKRKEFADRKRNYVVQGVNTTGWFVGIKENSSISSVSNFNTQSLRSFTPILMDGSSLLGA